VRAVLDPNILVAALLSRSGAPAQLLSRWVAGEFELIVSDALLEELARALAYRKLRTRIAADDAERFVALLRETAVVAADPEAPRRSSDPGDDYLIALAEQEHALLVSGDRHLLDLAGKFPILTAAAFLAELTP
jgi:putative PIN family toxin of toxin-antitoxin system